MLLTIFLIRIPRARQPASEKSLTRDTVEGPSLAWNTPIFLSLLTVLGIVTFRTKPYTQFMPVFARDILQVGAPGLGLLLMAPGAGAILGGLTLASVSVPICATRGRWEKCKKAGYCAQNGRDNFPGYRT